MMRRWCLVWGLACLSSQALAKNVPIELRDPTKPVIEEVITKETSKAEETYKLQSIIISTTRRLALINDKLVKIGDKIGSATVEMIEKNSVTLSKSGHIVTIFLIDMRAWEQKK